MNSAAASACPRVTTSPRWAGLSHHVAGPPASNRRRNDMLPTQRVLWPIAAFQWRLCRRIGAGLPGGPVKLPVLAIAAALALGLGMAGPATAGDDGPRVKRHDEARVSA